MLCIVYTLMYSLLCIMYLFQCSGVGLFVAIKMAHTSMPVDQFFFRKPLPAALLSSDGKEREAVAGGLMGLRRTKGKVVGCTPYY